MTPHYKELRPQMLGNEPVLSPESCSRIASALHLLIMEGDIVKIQKVLEEEHVEPVLAEQLLLGDTSGSEQRGHPYRTAV